MKKSSLIANAIRTLLADHDALRAFAEAQSWRRWLPDRLAAKDGSIDDLARQGFRELHGMYLLSELIAHHALGGDPEALASWAKCATDRADRIDEAGSNRQQALSN